MEEFNANNAKKLVLEYHKEYLNLLSQIKSAAFLGEEGILTPKIINFKIRSKLTALGFCITSQEKDDFIHWGS